MIVKFNKNNIIAVSLFRLTFCTALGTISWLAFTSGPPGVTMVFWDKFNHFAAFITLAFLADFAWPLRSRFQTVLIMILLICYGFAIEIIQSFLNYRYFDWNDLIADTLGVVIYIPCGVLLDRIVYVGPSKGNTHV